MKSHWLVKQEPASYPWSQLVADGKTVWSGVRNFRARNFLREMKTGDAVFYYHSVTGKEIVGLARVSRAAFPDPTAKEGDWSAVELEPVKGLARPVTLVEMKADALLKDVLMVKQSRLSVSPLTDEEFDRIEALSQS